MNYLFGLAVGLMIGALIANASLPKDPEAFCAERVGIILDGKDH